MRNPIGWNTHSTHNHLIFHISFSFRYDVDDKRIRDHHISDREKQAWSWARSCLKDTYFFWRHRERSWSHFEWGFWVSKYIFEQEIVNSTWVSGYSILRSCICQLNDSIIEFWLINLIKIVVSKISFSWVSRGGIEFIIKGKDLIFKVLIVWTLIENEWNRRWPNLRIDFIKVLISECVPILWVMYKWIRSWEYWWW